mgnify:CR=1 FL=1
MLSALLALGAGLLAYVFVPRWWVAPLVAGVAATLPTLFLLLFVPMWVSEVLRSFAWFIILAFKGPLNALLMGTGLLDQPVRWDLGFIRNFMLVLGSVSSLFDFLTFGLLLYVFKANEALFQTGWFIESLATQMLVIFVIRTRLNPLRSRPSRVLAATSLAVIAAAVVLPYSPVGGWFGFVPLPPAFLLALAIIAACYLLLAECAKRWFYRRHPPRGTMRSPVARPQLPLIGG